MYRLLQVLAALTVSLALVAAPCKNCDPKPVKADAQKCQHDCCPKPKPEKANCKWAPADYAALEAKQELQASAQVELSLMTVAFEAPLFKGQPVLEPQAESEPPPIYLAVRQLRI